MNEKEFELLHRAVVALESIAESLVKQANPPVKFEGRYEPVDLEGLTRHLDSG